MRTRSRVLLGWEFGAGFQHVNRMLEIARILKSDGWEPVFALRDLANGHWVRAAGFEVLQAPLPPSLVAGFAKYRSGSYGEIIAAYGFGDFNITSTVLAAWDALIEAVQPIVAIADYSPFLSLACYGRVPVIAIGDGFVSPPAELAEFPLIHRNGTRPFDHMAALEAVNRVQAARGKPAVSTLPRAVGGTMQIVCTYPEMDVYRRRRPAQATGPFAPPPSASPPPAQHRIFFYLAADYPPTWQVIKAIAESGLPAHGYIRSASRKRLDAFVRDGLVFYDEPLPIQQALSDSTAILHHGGIGTSEAAIAGGRPQLLVPRHLEQLMNAKALMSLGVAIVLATPFKDEAALAAIGGLRTNRSLYAAADRVGRQIARREHGRSAQILLEACRQFATGAQAAAE